MNAKQSLRLCSARLAEVETVLARAKADIKDYNACIDSMIAGGSPCDWCEDQCECQLAAKAEGKGCAEWWLRYRREEESKSNESEGLLSPSGDSGEEPGGIASQIKAF